MKIAKKTLSVIMAALMVLSCWVWTAPDKAAVANAADAEKNHYLFAYFTGNSSDGQTVHLAVSKDGLHYTALRNNEPVIIPSKGTGAVRDPYIWYDTQTEYYYLICTDMDADIPSDPENIGYWWDNSDAFIMWRSKDLVHWFDETYINIKDLLNNNFGANVGDVYRAWAPQILWDGSSYIVYFSLTTDNATYNSDNLAIVYLSTSDLMDLTKYTGCGYILDPGEKIDVNDADIIQHPSNGNWYLFYKTETPQGESYAKVKMMVGDSATGPYTSADSSTTYGLDVFSTVGEALEGGNGFFDNEGNFVMYADAYMHNGSTSTPYFYVAKTSANGDFTSWSIYGEDTHNINSLSPRHGSVVKISEAEYNNLLNNALSISSSSFPEDATLTDHLVARYFTTDNVKYNAATEQEDLTISGSLSPVNYNKNGVGWYADFTGSQYATVDLNTLLPASLNFNDGFTITFTARADGNNDSRFFQLLNGSSSTEIACWGGSSGLYATYDNTQSVLDITTSYFNNGSFHDYMISYANGNLIIYVDGELVLKKNRFNSPSALQQTPLMDEAWYNNIGNGTLAIGALVGGGAAIDAAISNFCLYDCAMSYYDIEAIQLEQDLEAGFVSTSALVVPETVYMTPSTGASTTAQYYVNNLLDKDTKTVKLEAVNDKTTGTIQFYIPGATDVKIAVNTITAGIGDVVFNKEGVSLADYLTDGYFSYTEATLSINGTGLTAGQTALAEWVFTITMSDGSIKTYYAYTTLYSPFYRPVGSAIKLRTKGNDINNSKIFSQSVLWISGVHSFLKTPYKDSTHSNSFNNAAECDVNYIASDSMLTPLLNKGSVTGSSDGETGVSSWLVYNELGTFRYTEIEGKANDMWMNEVSPTALITVDTSRYTNFNQIPNLTIGLLVTDVENATKSHWYLSDYTDADTSKMGSSYGNDWWEPYGTLIAGTPENDIGTSDKYRDAQYNGVYPRDISDGVTRYVIKSGAHSYGQSNDATTNMWILLDATQVDKSSLRNTLSSIYAKYDKYGLKDGYGSYYYDTTSDAWKNFINLYQDAAMVLGNPTANQDQVNVVEQKVKEAMANLDANQSRKIIFDVNYGGINPNLFTLDTTAVEELVKTYDGSEISMEVNSTFDTFKFSGTKTEQTEFGYNTHFTPTVGTYTFTHDYVSGSMDGYGCVVFEARTDAKANLSPRVNFDNFSSAASKISQKTFDGNTAQMIDLMNVRCWTNGTYTFNDLVYRFKIEEGDTYTGYSPAARMATAEGKYPSLYTPEREGYTFAGWYTDKTFTKSVSAGDPVTSCRLYAKWVPNEYRITFDSLFDMYTWANTEGSVGANGAISNGVAKYDSSDNSVTIKSNASYGECFSIYNKAESYGIPLKQNTNYVFEYTVDEFYSDSPAAQHQAFVFIYDDTNTWVKYGDGSSETSKSNYKTTTGTFKIEFLTPDKDVDFRFRLGTHNPSASGTKASVNVKFSDVRLYEKNRDSVISEVSCEKPITVTYDTAYSLPTPKRKGYTFTGWYDENGNGYWNGETVKINSDKVLYSTWKEGTYNIVFNGNGGVLSDNATAYSVQNIVYSAEYEIPANTFEKTGYRFLGWNTDVNGNGTTYTAGQIVTALGDVGELLKLYAQWEVITSTVTFDNLIDFNQWNKNSASNGTISNITGNGFTLTSNDDADEATSSSPYFPVVPGKQYKIDMNIIGDAWDVYIFFCDANGQWIDFNDETNRYSSNGSTGISKENAVFIAPDKAEVVKAQIRVDANGSNNAVRFENIRIFDVGCDIPAGVPNSIPSMSFTYGDTYTNLPEPTRDGYSFIGWFTSYNEPIENGAEVALTGSCALYSKWVVSEIVVDFDSSVTFNLFDSKDSDFFTLNSVSAEDSSGSFSASTDNKTITYSPENVIDAMDIATYSVSYGDTSKEIELYIVPASNILYEEDKLTVSNTTGNAWSDVGTVATAEQSSADEVYGYDSTYNTFDTYSGGAAKKVSVSSTAKRGQIMSFSFSGTGFDLYSQCAADTGILIVTVKNNDTGSMVNASIVDTYYSTTLNQVPVVGIRDLDYGSYTVQVSAMYLSTAGALQGTSTQAAFGLGDITMYSAPMSSAEMLYTALEEVGLEEIFEADDLQVIWFDEGSVFANGSAAATYTLDTETETVSTRAIPEELVCVIDSVRVYNPGNPDIINEYYPASEQGASYYNIMSNLKSGTLTNGNGSFGYVSYTIDDEEIDFDTYETKGSNEEVYLASDNENAGLAFGISGIANGGKIMISLRAADGKATTAKIGENTIAINSATEMYYDVTDYITDGTIAIQNIGDGLLAIGNVKATGAAAPIVMSTFNMRAARMMMMAPVASDESDESEAPEEPSTEEPSIEEPSTEEPSTEETTTEEATTSGAAETDSSSNEKSLLDKLYDFIDFIVALIKKIFSTLDFMKNL